MADLSERLKTALADRYRIERELGSGGMATVYLAHDLKHDRKVALKIMRPELSAILGGERFLREIRIAARLNHPHILALYDSGSADGFLYYVMPHVEGESLRAEIEREKQLSIDEAVDLARQVASALDYAHQQGVVHRDIKPENILLHRGEAVVADFGIALAVTAAGGDRLTETGLSLGTPEYMSPEQATGGGEVDARADIYSLGAVLYEMVTGEPPQTGATVQAVIAKLLSERPTQPHVVRDSVPEAMDRAIMKALAKVPADRFGNAAEFAAALTDKAVAEPDDKSVAVLPFANLSPDPEMEYFSDGMTEEIINALTQLEDLRVAARTSSFWFKGKSPQIAEVGEKLKVATVLEGSVRRAGSKLRITAQLVNVAGGYHLWSERYDRDMEDVFAIQDEIAAAVTETLKSTLLGAPKGRMDRSRTDDLEAYELYLKGRFFWNQRGAGLQKGLQCFQSAVERDPDYALAHAGMADCYLGLGFYGYIPMREGGAKAKTAALRALEIDEGLGEAHATLGFAGVCYDWDMEAAEKDFKRAIELDPGYAPTYYWYATMFIALGRFEDAFRQNKRSLEVDPLSIFATAHYGWCLIGGQQYERARDQLKRALELYPNYPHTHWLLGWTYAIESRFEDSIAHLQKALELSADYPWFLAHLGCVYGVSGRADEARAVLSQLNVRREDEYVRSLYFALVHVGLGDLDETLDWLEKAYEERDAWMVWLNTDPTFDALRSEPRFIALLKRIGVE